MDTERELLSRAAEQLARVPRNIGDLLLGDEIYKFLRDTKDRETPIEESIERLD